MIYYTNKEIKELIQTQQIVVFGAGAVAEAVVNCLIEKPYQMWITYCMVSNPEGNPESISGVPVIGLSDAEKIITKDTLLVIAAAEKNLDSIKETLRRHGYNHIIILAYENDLWSLVRGNYYRELRIVKHKPYLTIEEELEKVFSSEDKEDLCVHKDRKMFSLEKAYNSIKIYTVRCHVDRKLQENTPGVSWEIPIQAGAALSGLRICGICDDTGDNISHKNKQYCELTALYWIWKNDTSSYVGLSHYRRHFELDEERLMRLACSDIDVVLTIPIFDFPSVEAVYRRDHVGKDWSVMMDAIRILYPEYMAAAEEIGQGQFYYAYNMFIMRRTILEKYCNWIFPILSYCEEHCDEKTDIYQSRYLGFLAEHLMSIYFLYHEKEYKIVHARKHFIEY